MIEEEVQRLLRQRAVDEAIEEMSRRILHDAAVIACADEFLAKYDAYIRDSVTLGPENVGDVLAELVRAAERYREVRK